MTTEVTRLPLDFPPITPPTVREDDGEFEVLDRVRRRFVRLTPEEWVRQHLIGALIETLGYPVGLLAVEPTIVTRAGPRRPDLVAYGRDRAPLLIAECKAPTVKLTQEVLDQVGRYNLITGAPYLMVTNGRAHVCWRTDGEARSHTFLKSIPNYRDLS